jgi:hypothetical protein
MATINLNAPFASQPANDNNSKKTMLYTTDDGKKIPVQINENYGELLGFDDFTGSIPDDQVAPNYLRFEMRRVYASDVTGRVKQSFPIGKPDEDIYIEGGSIIVPRKGKADGLTLYVTGSVGEKKTFPNAGDTGQRSGDDT